MRNYEAPRIDVVEFEASDVITTSGGGLIPGGNASVPGTGVIVPIPGATATGLDGEY